MSKTKSIMRPPPTLPLVALLLFLGRVGFPEPTAFVGATLLPISSPPILEGVLIVEDDRIVAVGPLAGTPIPANASRVDVSGKTIMPGLVCTHSHIGDVSGADQSAPIQPEVRVLDSINVLDPSVSRARAGGLTTVNIMSGSGHLLSGQTAYLKLRRGNTIEALAIREPDGSIAGGIKMANGTNSRRDPPFPGTRAKSAALIRARLIEAQSYQRKLERAASDSEVKPPDRDLALEALVEVLEGRKVVHHHTHRHDDILTVLRLREEFGFEVVLHHVSEAWKVIEPIAEAQVACSIILLDSPGGKLEARDIAWRNGRLLEEAGVLTAFHTDDPVTDSRWFLRSAAFARRAGMSREGALAGVTTAAAAMLGLERRIGSLDAGKDADFIVLSGDPLSVYTRVEETWIEGQRVFDLDDPEDQRWALGGVGAGDHTLSHNCCFTHNDDDDR